MVHWLLKEVIWSFYPPRYKQLCNQKVRSSLKFLSSILFVSFILASVLFLPKIVTIRSAIEHEIDKFSVFDIKADVSTSAPVVIPSNNPLFVVDASSDRNISKEFFVVTKDSVKYRLFGRHSVPLSGFKNIKESKRIVSGFLSVLAVLMLPSVFILLYIKFWIKYFLIVFFVSLVLFILFELTRWRLKFRQVFNIACHTVLVMVVLEVVSAPFGTRYLFPFLKFLGVNVYAVSLALFSVFTVAGFVFVNVKKKK
ncbi:hypothetical protein DRJ22_00360 [Candidatus Woesearchaeota archaeon]|nr:MAG: hypothetical protein B6U93_03380 [Candidatus Woesearchaeota archaeon ex4484_78]RLE47009.1 MAG: hypothetical protein DRJ22_00360 [Candidatus Woesearchaeota archaeon]